MAQSAYRKKMKKDASDQFVLYVAFHSAWASLMYFCND